MSAKQAKAAFKATWTSVTVREGNAGNMLAEVNMDGHAEGFGPFIGTMTVTPAGAQAGTWRWASICWLEAGGSLDITGNGRFESDRHMHFTSTGILLDNLGRAMKLESTIDLASKTWAGAVLVSE